jgi:hypothetical protein
MDVNKFGNVLYMADADPQPPLAGQEPQPVQKPPAKKAPVKKDAVPAKPKAKPPVTADAAEKGKQLIAKLSLPLPITATGKSLATWSQDLKSVSKIEILHQGQWVNVWVNEAGEYKTEKAVPIPSVQSKAIIFMAQSSITRPVTDRGWAYEQWTDKHAAVLKAVFGQKDNELRVRVHFISAALPILEMGASKMIRRAVEMMEDLTASSKLKAPQARVSSPRTGGGKKEEFDFVFGI